MGFFDKLTSIFEKGVSSDDPLHKVTKEDHDKAIIKERPDLCISITETPQKTKVQKDGARDIIFSGWQICNVEERDSNPAHNDRRLGYLKLFKTKNDKFVCQRMTLIDDEEKHYEALTVEDIVDIRNFYGTDTLGVALMLMLDRVSKEW